MNINLHYKEITKCYPGDILVSENPQLNKQKTQKTTASIIQVYVQTAIIEFKSISEFIAST